jgi:hypothetical protein
MAGLFKECSCCGYVWETQKDFLDDPGISIVGYKADFEILEEGLFFFNHEDCGSTITLRTCAFRNLYDGPVYTTRATGTPECPGYCLHKDALNPCPARCECQYVRSIVQTIKEWPKKEILGTRS